MITRTRRKYLPPNPRYELMLGTTFRSIGGYLDECCLRNASDHEGCAVAAQCRKWWDRKCERTRSQLSEAEIVSIIAQFEEVREGWSGISRDFPDRRVSPSIGRRLLAQSFNPERG
jgi:hypothetical protein